MSCGILSLFSIKAIFKFSKGRKRTHRRASSCAVSHPIVDFKNLTKGVPCFFSDVNIFWEDVLLVWYGTINNLHHYSNANSHRVFYLPKIFVNVVGKPHTQRYYDRCLNIKTPEHLQIKYTWILSFITRIKEKKKKIYIYIGGTYKVHRGSLP